MLPKGLSLQLNKNHMILEAIEESPGSKANPNFQKDQDMCFEKLVEATN